MSRQINDKLKVSFNSFQYLGFFLGGIAPVAMFLTLAVIGLNKKVLDEEAFGLVTILLVFNAILGLSVLNFYSKEKNTISFTCLYTLQAFASFFLTHLLVLYSGGSTQSVFSFSYLYIPSIIIHAYKGFINLTGALLILTPSCIFNVFLISLQKSFFKPLIHIFDRLIITYDGRLDSDWLYLFIFLLELVAIILTFKSKERR